MGSIIVDSAAANKLNISITSITPAQAWKNQIRGVYALIYVLAQADFVHIKDFTDWLKKSYQKHTHTGNKGKPTSKPNQAGVYSTRNARNLLESNKVVGYIRKGLQGAAQIITDIDKIQNEDLS